MDPICAALFVRKDSVYKTIPGVDCWDLNRNAYNWTGGIPVIAHPPCRLWSTLSTCVTQAPASEKDLAPWAVSQVQKWGGVLEHPAGSRLFKECDLPEIDGFPDNFGGYTILVNQWDWGHRASKPTKLYIVGIAAKNLPGPFPPRREGKPAYCVTQGKNVRIGHPKFLPRIPDWEREATPPDFARWLVEIAASCKVTA